MAVTIISGNIAVPPGSSGGYLLVPPGLVPFYIDVQPGAFLVTFDNPPGSLNGDSWVDVAAWQVAFTSTEIGTVSIPYHLYCTDAVNEIAHSYDLT